MISVSEAAQRLGVSGARVRALIDTGKIEATKIGRTWAVSEASVQQRLRDGSRGGRPSAKPKPFVRQLPDTEAAHVIYDEAKRVLAGCYDADFLKQARTAEERAFWIRTADFFLQERQRELVKAGVF